LANWKEEEQQFHRNLTVFSSKIVTPKIEHASG
jgi:hypothetical protein